jgi:hypothetical protein
VQRLETMPKKQQSDKVNLHNLCYLKSDISFGSGGKRRAGAGEGGG